MKSVKDINVHCKRKLPNNARCGLCNNFFINDGFGLCGRLNHLTKDGEYPFKNENDVCGNYSRNCFIKDKEEQR